MKSTTISQSSQLLGITLGIGLVGFSAGYLIEVFHKDLAWWADFIIGVVIFAIARVLPQAHIKLLIIAAAIIVGLIRYFG